MVIWVERNAGAVDPGKSFLPLPGPVTLLALLAVRLVVASCAERPQVGQRSFELRMRAAWFDVVDASRAYCADISATLHAAEMVPL